MAADDGLLQLLFVSIGNEPLGLLRYFIGHAEPDAPVKEQPQFDLHWVDAGLGHNKAALGHGLKFIRS